MRPKLIAVQLQENYSVTRSITEWARILEVKQPTLYPRARVVGMAITIQELLGVSARKKGSGAKTYEVDGVHYTLEELAKKAGVHKHTVWLRMKSGMSPAKASEPTSVIKLDPETTIAQLASEAEVSRQAVHDYRKRHTDAETVKHFREEAGRHLPGRGRPLNEYDYKGKRLTLEELSALHGVPAHVIAHRLQDKWTLEEAVTTPVQKVF